MAMTIEFADERAIALLVGEPSAIRLSARLFSLLASEGESFSFAAVGPSMEAWKPTPPSHTTSVASGPASMDGSNGKFAVFAKWPGFWTPRSFFKAMVSAIIMLASVSGTAIADDDVNRDATQSHTRQRLATNLSGEASVRIIELAEENPRVRFSASGLPAGLSIHPQTGVISGVIDREASRNGGSSFIVKVAVSNGTVAAGVSTIGIIVENRAPVAVNDVLRLSSKPAQLNVLANDFDPDGDRLVLNEASAAHGAVAFTTDGVVAYAPNSRELRTDIINYQVSDGHGGTKAARVAVHIE
jgi:Bacterial Ig domain